MLQSPPSNRHSCEFLQAVSQMPSPIHVVGHPSAQYSSRADEQAAAQSDLTRHPQGTDGSSKDRVHRQGRTNFVVRLVLGAGAAIPSIVVAGSYQTRQIAGAITYPFGRAVRSAEIMIVARPFQETPAI